jgi:sporulation protein YlmC with PRC-barrel domain
MRIVTLTALAATIFTTSALARDDSLLGRAPTDATTINNYYKQSVYDQSDNKIGDIADVLLSRGGRVDGLVVGVGGFLGAGEKDVLVPFDAVHNTMKDNKWYLVMNTTKDALKSAQGFKYDSSKTAWFPDTSQPAAK